MESFILLFFYFTLGLIVGSFLNLLLYRLEKMDTLLGRSKCVSCLAQLQVLDLIPILSYVFSRGKCRHCGVSYSIRYPLVEITTGIVFLLGFLYASDIPFYFAFAPLWVAIAYYDAWHKLIPDVFSFPLLFLTVLFVIFYFDFLTLLAGPLLAMPFFLVWYFSKGRAMGSGDILLGLHVGWFVGISGIIPVFLFTFWFAAFFALIVIIFQRLAKKSVWKRDTEVPLGPFLILTTFLEVFVDLGDVLMHIFL